MTDCRRSPGNTQRGASSVPDSSYSNWTAPWLLESFLIKAKAPVPYSLISGVKTNSPGGVVFQCHPLT